MYVRTMSAQHLAKDICLTREMLCGHSADIVRTYISRDICPHNVRTISFFGFQLCCLVFPRGFCRLSEFFPGMTRKCTNIASNICTIKRTQCALVCTSPCVAWTGRHTGTAATQTPTASVSSARDSAHALHQVDNYNHYNY